MSEEREKQPGDVQGAESFFRDEVRVLGGIAGDSGFTFSRGNNWAIDPETGNATYDPKFFEEKGYTPTQALFGALHEIKSHLVETADLLSTPEGERAHKRLKTRIKDKKRVHIWENCRTDAKGNQAILGFAPALSDDVETLYKEKLWPETDLTDKPKHLQFMYAVLRQTMIPGEQVQIGPAVQSAIEGLRNVKGKDVIALSTDPNQDALLALRLSERYIEPVIEKLYQQDLEEKKESQQKDSGEPQGEGGEVGEPDESTFADDYEDYERRHPEAMDEAEVEEKIKETKEAQSESARQDRAYEEEHGVSTTDIADYYQEYRQVEGQIEPFKDIFRKIVEERQIILRHLSALKEEGVMIDPGLVAQTYLDIHAGVENPRTMKDFEGVVFPENIPGAADIYFIKDQSGSMQGDKSIAQRRGAIVEAEALKEGADILEEEQLPDPLKLDISTAFIGFGTGGSERVKTYKKLSSGLTEKQRVEIFKGLLELGDIGTNDYDGLVVVEKELKSRISQDSQFAGDLNSGKRKVVVIVTTDGGSNYQGMNEAQARLQTKKKADDLRALGVKVKAIAFVPSPQDTKNIQDVYGKTDTAVCHTIDNYPQTVASVLEKDVLGELHLRDNIE